MTDTGAFDADAAVALIFRPFWQQRAISASAAALAAVRTN